MADLKPVCRIGDQGQGVCYLHDSPTPYTTTFISNPGTTVTADGLVVCTIGAIGQATCGHQTIATTGSGQSIDINGNAFHRVGDQGHVIGSDESVYTAITGSSIVSSE